MVGTDGLAYAHKDEKSDGLLASASCLKRLLTIYRKRLGNKRGSAVFAFGYREETMVVV